MTLQGAMRLATHEVMEEEGLDSITDINEYDCFNWAFRVFNLVPGTAIGGHRIDDEGQSYIIYKGLCYDAESPAGRANWWELNSFARMMRA